MITRWMAPEVCKVDPGSMAKSRLNAKKIGLHSFAIVCAEILSLDNPFPNVLNNREHVRAGHRPKLPDDCPDKLATLIKRCCDPRPHERPKFETICAELRNIKGNLLLRGFITSLEKGEDQADGVEIRMTTTKLISRFFKIKDWESFVRFFMSLDWEFFSRFFMSLGRNLTLCAGLYLLHYVRNILVLWVLYNLWRTEYTRWEPTMATLFVPGATLFEFGVYYPRSIFSVSGIQS